MTLFRLASLAGASLLLIGGAFGSAEAMPMASLGAQAPGVEQVAYLHRHYPG